MPFEYILKEPFIMENLTSVDDRKFPLHLLFTYPVNVNKQEKKKKEFSIRYERIGQSSELKDD